MLDATLIPAWASTKNKAKRRDDKRHQTKKDNPYDFGMKGPIGADVNSGTVPTVAVTAANVADVSVLPGLLSADDRAVFGDAGDAHHQLKKAAGVFWGVALKARSKRKLEAGQKRHHRKMSSIRSRVEPVFRVMKCPFGDQRVIDLGLQKNMAQVFPLIGLTNLHLPRKALAACAGRCVCNPSQ